MAKGALEEKLADAGMSVDDLEQPTLERHINELLLMQGSACWKARHCELQGLREGLYVDLYAEREARAAHERQSRMGGCVMDDGAGGGAVGKAINPFTSTVALRQQRCRHPPSIHSATLTRPPAAEPLTVVSYGTKL